MREIGVFLEAGGNKVFFVNGVLAVIQQAGVKVDALAGFSSSAAVALAFITGQSEDITRTFSDKLDANARNFYLFDKPHFPHDGIYRESVRSLVHEYRSGHAGNRFVMWGARSPMKYARTKALFASLVLLLRFGSGINLLGAFRRVSGVEEMRVTEENDFSEDEFIAFIMGSSAIYPFIGLNRVRGSLILDGALLEITYQDALSECRSKIVIHTEKGVTGEKDGVFHVYSDTPVPGNVLDYTDGSAVRELHASGKRVMTEHLRGLQAFLTDR
ncbi:patatin-like phospholipase family protein [Candidatus Kaiserbacteria bacterium]|nr:patatin-like phospholipase family protein [Candidatus Kaiserbacteria bacterium]